MAESGIATYLPGCYAHLRPHPDESLPGFLLRLAEANGYTGIRDLLSAVFPDEKTSLLKSIFEIRMSADRLMKLGRVACGDSSSLTGFRCRPLGTDAMMVQGCRVEDHGFIADGNCICPTCLEENHYARDEWELSPVTVCSRHLTPLIDSCPCCNAKVHWNRQRLNLCDSCGRPFGLRHEKATASEAECRLAEDFAALADFRVEYSPGNVGTVSWGGMLNIAQAFAQSPDAWLSDELRRIHSFARFPIAARRAFLAAIAGTRNPQASYQLFELRELVRGKYAVLVNFLPEDYVAELAFTFLMRCAELSPEAGHALSGMAGHKIGDGAAMFGGRPPILTTREEVSAFLGIELTAYRYLRRHHVIPFHDSEEALGLDIDSLLKTKYFIKSRMAGIDVIGGMLGIEVTWDVLYRFPFALGMRVELGPDNRVEFERLREIQLMWLDKTASMAAPRDGVRFGDCLAPLTTDALATCIFALLNGHFTKCQWLPPFRWIDFAVEREEINRLNLESRSTNRAGACQLS